MRSCVSVEAWLRYVADSDEDESFNDHDDSNDALSISSNDSTITVEFNGNALLAERNDHEMDGQADIVEHGRFLPLHYRREDLDLNHNDDHDNDDDFRHRRFH